jgi:hypothetical protein
MSITFHTCFHWKSKWKTWNFSVKNLNSFPVLFWLKIRVKLFKENSWLLQRV